MMRNYYADPDGWDLVVLDFDLSWHRDALEGSVLAPQAATGYLAPEQLVRDDRVSTRSALVDSYGIGMTLYYVATKREPLAAEHKHLIWPKRLADITRDRPCAAWKSLPTRFARLIDHATKDVQAARWDMAQIQFELERLQDAELNPGTVVHTDMLAEEIVARAFEESAAYAWSDDDVSASVHLPSGAHFVVRPDDPSGVLRLTIAWSSTGEADWRRINKWVDSAGERAAACLRRGKWLVSAVSKGSQSFALEASIPARDVLSGADAAVALQDAAGCLRFE
jgi:hypothetical protein